MRARISDGGGALGGSLGGYPLDRLYEEMAFIGYYFHWPFEQVVHMEHRERQRWVEEISSINQKLSEN